MTPRGSHDVGQMLQELDATLEARRHRQIIAEMKGRVREELRQFYPTASSATQAHR